MNTNCINCGAPLHSDKCDYCGTEYTLNEFGQIKEYIIKLNILGEEKEFYIGDIEKHKICSNAVRDPSGFLVHDEIGNKLTLKLIEI